MLRMLPLTSLCAMQAQREAAAAAAKKFETVLIPVD